MSQHQPRAGTCQFYEVKISDQLRRLALPSLALSTKECSRFAHVFQMCHSSGLPPPSKVIQARE